MGSTGLCPNNVRLVLRESSIPSLCKAMEDATDNHFHELAAIRLNVPLHPNAA